MCSSPPSSIIFCLSATPSSATRLSAILIHLLLSSPILHPVAPSFAPRQANVARLVGVLWDNNDPPNHPSSDCMTNEPPHYFNDACFDTLDPWVKTATDNGIWVVLAVRAQVGAGQYYDTRPGTVVFRNSTLKMMFYAMWSHVADHYASFDRIAVRPTPTSTSSQVWITCNVFFLFLLFYLGFGCYANLTDLLLCAPTTTDFNLNFLFRRMRFYRSLVTNQSAKM